MGQKKVSTGWRLSLYHFVFDFFKDIFEIFLQNQIVYQHFVKCFTNQRSQLAVFEPGFHYTFTPEYFWV